MRKTIQIIFICISFICAVIKYSSHLLWAWLRNVVFYLREVPYLYSVKSITISYLEPRYWVSQFVFQAHHNCSMHVIGSMLATIVSTSFGVLVYMRRSKLPSLQISTCIHKLANLIHKLHSFSVRSLPLKLTAIWTILMSDAVMDCNMWQVMWPVIQTTTWKMSPTSKPFSIEWCIWCLWLDSMGNLRLSVWLIGWLWYDTET